MNDLCGAVDSDGMDDCGLPKGHSGAHYSLDPAGPIRRRRRCLACERRTTALLCVCRKCRKSGVDPATARKETVDRAFAKHWGPPGPVGGGS